MENPQVLIERLDKVSAEAQARIAQQRLAAERLAELVSDELERVRVKGWIEKIEEVVLEDAHEGKSVSLLSFSWDYESYAIRDRKCIALGGEFFGDVLTIQVDNRDSEAKLDSDDFVCVDASWHSIIQISRGEAETATNTPAALEALPDAS